MADIEEGSPRTRGEKKTPTNIAKSEFTTDDDRTTNDTTSALGAI